MTSFGLMDPLSPEALSEVFSYMSQYIFFLLLLLGLGFFQN